MQKIYKNMQQHIKICRNMQKFKICKNKLKILASFIVCFWKAKAISIILNVTYIFMSNMQICKIPGSRLITIDRMQ